MRRLGLMGLAVGSALGCRQEAIADPRVAAAQYAQAIETGDARALHQLLDAEGQAALSPREVAQLLKGSRGELRARSASLTSSGAQVEAHARVQYGEGDVARLVIEDGAFRVTAERALPALAQTPAEAVAHLRSALQRRSFTALMHSMAPRSRAKLEAYLSQLLEDLQYPETLDVTAERDVVVVATPRGHRVELQREGGSWKVRDFE